MMSSNKPSICNRFIPFMGMQGFLLEPIPAVSGRGRGYPLDKSPAHRRALTDGRGNDARYQYGSASCSSTLQHAAQLSPELGFEPATFQSLADTSLLIYAVTSYHLVLV